MAFANIFVIDVYGIFIKAKNYKNKFLRYELNITIKKGKIRGI